MARPDKRGTRSNRGVWTRLNRRAPRRVVLDG